MKTFLDTYQAERMHYSCLNLNEFLAPYPKTRVHSMSIATLFGYYDFYRWIGSNRIYFFKGLVILPAPKKLRALVLDPTRKYDFSLITQKLEVISAVEMDMPGFVKSKTEELMYDIPAVFNRANYHSAKDWARSVSNPRNLTYRYDFRSVLLEDGNLDVARSIHTEWVAKKLADPKVFKMTFGAAKYWRLIEDYVHDYHSFFPGLVRIGYVNDKPFGVECDYIIGDTAFAMSSFDLHWKREEFHSNLSEGVRLAFLQELLNRGVRYFNYGFSLNARLKGFKSHWPYETVIVYRYTKEETPQPKSVLDL